MELIGWCLLGLLVVIIVVLSLLAAVVEICKDAGQAYAWWQGGKWLKKKSEEPSQPNNPNQIQWPWK